jgi:hypothetical protein
LPPCSHTAAARQIDRAILLVRPALTPSPPALSFSSSRADGAPAAGARRTSTGIGARHDSAATIADLEAGAGGAGEADVVPVRHVRRLTATLVDILRQMAAAPGGATGAAAREAEGALAAAEAAGLLAGASDAASDAFTEDGKASLASASAASGSSAAAPSARSARDSEISASTALLKAAYLPQEEYRGDVVRPFWADARGATAPTAADDAGLAPLDGKPADGGDGDGADGAPGVPARLKKVVRVNWLGLAVFLLYIGAFITYVAIRAAKTLGLGASLWYGIVVLAVEILGGLAMLPYGLCLCVRVADYELLAAAERAAAAAAAKAAGGEGAPALSAAAARPAATALGYHVRVLIPCYKEPLEVIQKTLLAAMYAPLPLGCRRTVYLLDDGRDADKRAFVRALRLSNAVYVSGRKRAKGEMNGKSANINSACAQIYPGGASIPLDEVLCVFDADQVPNADFFTRTVPLLDGGRDIAMVLSPQTFYNLNPDGDIFNHANVRRRGLGWSWVLIVLIVLGSPRSA